MRATLSVIKADTGGFDGHTDVHPRMLELTEAQPPPAPARPPQGR